MLFGKTAGILLAGLAGYAVYKLSKMSPQQKKDLTDNLKNQGRKIFGQFMPENKSGSTATSQQFGE